MYKKIKLICDLIAHVLHGVLNTQIKKEKSHKRIKLKFIYSNI